MKWRGTLRRRKSRRQNHVWLLLVAIAIVSLLIASAVLAAQTPAAQPSGFIPPLVHHGVSLGYVALRIS